MSRRARGALGLLALLLVSALVRPAQATDIVVYYHTDALRSVAVVTNASGQVIERTHYAPYGQVLDRPLRDGPGYAGHEEDAATGLVYMQQRYYDPESGRFLSADPVDVDPNSGGNFNRYWYANDNPYRYTDPDGRETGIAFHSEFVAMGAQPQMYQAPDDWVGPALQAAFSSLPVIGPAFGVLNAAANPTSGNVAAAAAGVLPLGAVAKEAASIKSAGDVVEAAKGVAQGKNIVAPGGRAAAKSLFRAADVAGKGGRTITKDVTGGGRAVVGKTADGNPIRIRFKPDGTTRIQAADKKIIFPKEKQ